MGEIRRRTRARAAEIRALHREIRERVSANTAEFLAAYAAGDSRRMARVMDDTLTMTRYAAWLRRLHGYGVARLGLQPLPARGITGRARYLNGGVTMRDDGAPACARASARRAAGTRREGRWP